MKKLGLIYNPVSGHALFKGKIDFLIDLFQRHGIVLTPYRTRGGGKDDLGRFLRDIRPEGVLAAGGDGTVHAVVNAMLESDTDVPLGILGSGTSNDFATHLGIHGDWESYVERIAADESRRVDLGLLEGHGQYFINVVSAGMLTGIAHEVKSTYKNALGKVAYYLKGIGEIPRLRSFSLRIAADGVQYEEEAFLFVIANSPVVAGMKQIGHDIAIDDGMLDLLAVKKTGLPQFMSVAADLFSGKSVTERENILHVRAKSFEIHTEEELCSDIDGEYGPLLPLRVRTLPLALSVYC
ncbi:MULTISPECIES: diacylglycerol kinase family protein [Selenomonas]|uniref:YegS/Rv2252/BmrU family lipid kinase n=1 Tax=Selenomonas timonae TaxID=2754044 RepID=A0A7G7VIL1_9FIRM|nr:MULTISPECIES: YegS/Rv2252/BmrU family lipid kinase [Selenomonas]EKX98703.1 lipid kinase, YegS/Rv2252/BmrU family [Selenomonas sp. oral taxon 138 str. F0429]QNH53954.1 YegS/Rv2252/BmrU family lipid kinase [Selenomonas timonae]